MFKKLYQQYNEETKHLTEEIERFDAAADKYDDDSLRQGNKILRQFLFYRTTTNITKEPFFCELLFIAFEIGFLCWIITTILRYV